MGSQPVVTGSGARWRTSRPYGWQLGHGGASRLREQRASAAPSHWGSLGSRNNVGKRGVASTAGLDWTAQVTGVSLRDRGDLRRRQLSRAIASTEADASRRSFGNGNSDQRRVWCGRNISAESQQMTTGMAPTIPTTTLEFLGVLG
ncbi:hypothetical protein V6N13_001283 [Hibiscus sabdariffa]|uniref:Uncharacterized protein n=1 Tax=Hibiscus sabdariffa TaxID=183260 RepID=A0ABR2G9B6_9ROSI